MTPLAKKITLQDLRNARAQNQKLPMLTCYDFTTAKLMQAAGIPLLLVGDSAANVILGHASTLPAPLSFMIQITAAVRRGAPLAMVIADMPFGSYQASDEQGATNVFNLLQQTHADAVKLEVAPSHAPLVRRLSDAGVAVIAHLGMRPQSVALMGGYKIAAKTPDQLNDLLASALQMQASGAAAILLEAVPPDAAKAVINHVSIPVIGCGAGPDCHASVIVTHDALNLTDHPPKFAPAIADLKTPMLNAYAEYARQISTGQYPAPQHAYNPEKAPNPNDPAPK